MFYKMQIDKKLLDTIIFIGNSVSTVRCEDVQCCFK